MNPAAEVQDRGVTAGDPTVAAGDELPMNFHETDVL
jgi:hypothetical protein